MIYLSFSHQLIHLLSQIKDREFENICKWLLAPIKKEILLEIGLVLKNYQVKTNFHLFLEDFQRSEAVKQDLLGYLNELFSFDRNQ